MPDPNPPIFIDVARTPGIPIESPMVRENGYIDAVYFNYLRQKPNVLTGTCIEYNRDLKEIKVDLDIAKTSSSVNTAVPVEINAQWGRPQLAENEVLGKRVKIWVQRETNKETKIEEVKELSLMAIAPPNAGLFW